MNPRLAITAAFGALLLVQVAPAATLAWQQTERLAAGRPVRLAVTTRDPRDLFRGEYSTLGYEIGQFEGVAASPAGLDKPCDFGRVESCSLGPDRQIYVRLEPDAEGVHRAAGVQFERPDAGTLFIAGRLRYGMLVRTGGKVRNGAVCEQPACLSGQATYGIETWYGPQGIPAKLDRTQRGAIRVEARVVGDGTAILDGITVDGKPFARTARLW